MLWVSIHDTKQKEASRKMMEEICRPIDLSDLIEAEQIKTAKRLKESIEEYQNKIVTEILALTRSYKRKGTYERGLVTERGEENCV